MHALPVPFHVVLGSEASLQVTGDLSALKGLRVLERVLPGCSSASLGSRPAAIQQQTNLALDSFLVWCPQIAQGAQVVVAWCRLLGGSGSWPPVKGTKLSSTAMCLPQTPSCSVCGKHLRLVDLVFCMGRGVQIEGLPGTGNTDARKGLTRSLLWV